MSKKKHKSVIDKIYGARWIKPMRDKSGNRIFFIYQNLTIFNKSTMLKAAGKRQLGQCRLTFKDALKVLSKYDT